MSVLGSCCCDEFPELLLSQQHIWPANLATEDQAPCPGLGILLPLPVVISVHSSPPARAWRAEQGARAQPSTGPSPGSPPSP